MEYAIFGARSIALGILRAMEELYSEHKMTAFLVSRKEDNLSILSGYPVIQIDEFSQKDITILIATPENYHLEITRKLNEKGFKKYVCLDSHKEQKLMEKYYKSINLFAPLSELNGGDEKPLINIYIVKFHKDKEVKNIFENTRWAIPIQVGTKLTTKRIAKINDASGINISDRNGNYCELTALYWIWKNKINSSEYIGNFHYRRFLDISEEDMAKLKYNDVDVVLPYPMIYEPDVLVHYTNYILEKDWNTMLDAIKELEPEYYDVALSITKQPYMYNYNMFVMKNTVLNKYCNWLFPILDYVYEKSCPAGKERNDRYIGYIGENLLTIYFLCNKDKLKIKHAKRIMLT